MNCVLELIEGQDLFAMPVTFSFRKKGGEQKTFIGGLISIIVRLSLVAYMAVLTSRMLKREDNSNETYAVKQEFLIRFPMGIQELKCSCN